MNKLARAGILLAGAMGVYLVILAVAGFVANGYVAAQIEASIARSLAAQVRVGTLSVSLIRGRIELGELQVTRPDGSHLELSVEHMELSMAPLGWLIFDQQPDEVYVRGVRMSISAMGALDLPRGPKRPPLVAGSLRIEDARLVVMPTALLPGLARMELTLVRATTGPVDMRSALDWIFAARELEIAAKLPSNRDISLGYQQGTLRVSGALFGAAPVSVPFTLPVPEPEDLELAKLRLLAKELIRALGPHATSAWLRNAVEERVRGRAE